MGKHRTKSLLKMMLVVACQPLLSGYVLFDKVGSTLPVSPGNPKITFKWDGQAPTLTDKSKIAGGSADDSDHDSFGKIITLAMANWSNVGGSFVKLAYTESSAATIDPTDHVFTIAIKALASASEGALAAPRVGSDGTISDCDIDVPPSSVPTIYMLHTVTHELGHCLGLGHAHTNYGAIMGYSGSQNQITLGSDDVAGLIYLYPDPNDPDYKKAQELVNVCGVVGAVGAAGADKAGLALLLLALPLAVPWVRRRTCR